MSGGNWDMVAVTSPEGWHELHLVNEDRTEVHVYAETPDLDPEDGKAVFQFVETRHLTPREPGE